MKPEHPDFAAIEWLNERKPEHTCYAVHNGRGVWLTEEEYRGLVEAGATVVGEGVAS